MHPTHNPSRIAVGDATHLVFRDGAQRWVDARVV